MRKEDIANYSLAARGCAAKEPPTMSTKVFLFAALSFIASSVATVAIVGAAPAVGAGTLMIQNKDYALAHALAYETKVEGEEKIVVVLTARPVSTTKLKEAREAEKEGESVRYDPPCLRLEYSKAGQFQSWSAAAGTATIEPRHPSTQCCAATGSVASPESTLVD